MIEVQDLRKNYGDVKALDGVSFVVPEGCIYGLLGPNGAGKSTTISILAGQTRPTGGRARIAGHDIATDAMGAKAALGLVPQEVVLYLELNARENLEFFGGLYGLRGAAMRARADELLTQMDLLDTGRRPASTYSGGQRRRLNLACGLVHRPRVLLLDEPTVGIDPQARLHILGLVRDIAGSGTTVLYTTHYLHEAEELCERIAIIDQGRILAEGTLAELRQAVGERDLISVRGRFDGEKVRSLASRLAGAEVLAAKDDELLLSCKHGSDVFDKLVRSLGEIGEIHEINIRQPSLENLFIKLTGRALRE